MSMTDKTAGGLTRFFDFVHEKGLMKKATASARKSAVTKVMEIDEDWESVDVEGLDVEQQLERFRNLRMDRYSPSSLSAYESRFRSAVDEYLGYLADPSSLKSKASAQAAQRPRPSKKVKPKERAAGSEVRSTEFDAETRREANPPSGGAERSTLVMGLIEKLPSAGSSLSEDEICSWLRLAELVLRSEYGSPQKPTE